MASGEYTFYPKFSEFVTLYRGVSRVWIADGTALHQGAPGKLYAEYIDGLIQDLGYVSDYEEAKKYFADLGITLTYPEWVATLAATPENAKRSEAWAVGKQHGEPVPSTDETYNNNAKYYADQSKIWTNGSKLDGTSVQPRDNATFWANEAHGWTNNKNGSVNDYSATNNAKYWAEQSKEYTNGTDLDGDTVAERATDNASYYNDQAKLWANNGTQGSTPGANNNSKYWAEQSKTFANGKDLSDQMVNPTDNSEYFKNQAKLWANNGTDGEAPSASNNAKYYSENSEESNKQAESWAKGTRDGQPDAVRQNAATDNALYYNEQSKLWANFGTEGNSPTATNNAKAYSDQSNENRLQAESWAVGTRDTSPDSIRPNAATNNAKYYSDNADTSANNAEESNLQSESWAKGTRDGSPDLERQNAAMDNSKYYSHQSNLWANFGTDGETPTAQNNAKEYARQASVSATAADESEAHAAQSDTHATTKASEADASAQAAALSEANAATSEANASASETNAATSEANAATSESNAATSESNAANSAAAAATSETNAHDSELAAAQSEANAAQSESDAAQHMTDAQTAKIAAETAQEKAESAISHNPRINSNDNWEIWDIQDEQWEDTGHKSIAYADIEYSYQNSTSGIVPPTGIWTNTPQPETAKFLWIRMKYTWTNGRIDYFYNVSYIGANGTGSVNSVNGIGGDVIIDGTNLFVDNSVQVKETVYGAITRIGTAITNAEIDTLF